MPRGKSTTPTVLKKAEKWNRTRQRLAEARKVVEKYEAADLEAEAEYLASIEQTLAARKAKPTQSGEEAQPANAP